MTDLVYLGPPAHSTPGDNLPPTRIVVHGTVSACKKGGARANAAYFKTEAAGGSAHKVVDPYEAVRVADDDVICWGAPPNPRSLHIELCDWQRGRARRWRGGKHAKMLAIAAHEVREWNDKYGIPIAKISTTDLLDGKHGICGHVDVTNAWHQSTHTDPGPGFPWAYFIAAVTTAGHPHPKPPTLKPRGGPHTTWVRRLQKALKIPVNGHYGPRTQLAVRVYRLKHGMLPSRTVGHLVWQRLGLWP